MKVLDALKPKTMVGQMIAILFASFAFIVIILMMLEVVQQKTPLDTANEDWIKSRIKSQVELLTLVDITNFKPLFTQTSRCHSGYTFSREPFKFKQQTKETHALEKLLSKEMNWDINHVKIGHVTLRKNDFSYNKCQDDVFQFPIDAVVISIKLPKGPWVNAEVHGHHWHVDQFVQKIVELLITFFIIACIAIFFIARLAKPLNNLNHSANKFAQGLEVSEIEETGPPDIKRTIQSFNAMQRQVKKEVSKRTETLAAMSHDIRTPLTALRIKAEFVENVLERESLIASIIKMEKITASALEFLKGENRTEAMKTVDLSILLESECFDFSESGNNVRYIGLQNVQQKCRPEALIRAVRNLIENAVKYGNAAVVDLATTNETVTLSVADTGPGIPLDKIDTVMEPFKRLSKARESNEGGFGLGLAIAKSIAEGHNSKLELSANLPSGLIVSITLNKDIDENI